MYAPYPPPGPPPVGTGWFYDDIAKGVKSVGKSVAKGVSKAAKGVAKAASGAAKGAANAIVSTTKAVVETAGDVVETVTSPVVDVVDAAMSVVEYIPVVGDAASIVGDVATGPLRLANSIASGARIDRAVVGELKKQLKNVKDIAPYAQTIVAMVPGVGTGVAAAIGAGAALAEGRSLDEAAKAAIRGAIPGGAVAAAGFDAAVKIAKGGSVTQAALEAARSALPPGAQKAFDIGTAVVTGENIQNSLASGLASLAGDQLGPILSAGEKAITSTPGMRQALNVISNPPGKEGFTLAAGLLGQTNISEKAIKAVRNKLPPEVRAGFDAALGTQAKQFAWLENVVGPPRTPPRLTAVPRSAPRLTAVPRKPPTLTAVPKSAVPKLAASPKAVIAAQANQAMVKATGPATGIVPPLAPPARGAPVLVRTARTERVTPGASPSSGGAPYAPYPGGGAVAGLGFAGGDKWRWFAVYNGGKLVSSRGPIRLSDHAALAEEAGFLESTQGRGFIGAVYRWDWDEDARTWRQVKSGGSLGLAGCELARRVLEKLEGRARPDPMLEAFS